MATWVPYVLVFLSLALVAKVWSQWRAGLREAYLRTYTLPTGIFPKLQKKHPELTLKDCQLVAQALRQYFLAYLKSGYRSVAMPSQVVDDLWHEFILYTRIYSQFCGKGFGRFMHHTPAAVLGTVEAQNVALRRCWNYACREEGINPRKPTRLPLLFAIDRKLNVLGGFRYALDCKSLGRTDQNGHPVYCGGDFSGGCSSAPDGTAGTTSDSGCTGDSGCSGGCGGD